MKRPFDAGDVVVLRSGGPTMTVEQCDISGSSEAMLVWCSWFDTTNKKKNDVFFATGVVLVRSRRYAERKL